MSSLRSCTCNPPGMVSLYHFVLSRGGLTQDQFLDRISRPHLCLRLPSGVVLGGGGSTVLVPPDDDAPELLTSRLVVELSGATGPTYTLGRGAENTFVVKDPRISKQHARLDRTPTGWTVTDLGSTNGTVVGQRRLPAGEACLLQNHQWIHLGEVVEVQFLLPEGLYEVTQSARRLLPSA